MSTEHEGAPEGTQSPAPAAVPADSTDRPAEQTPTSSPVEPPADPELAGYPAPTSAAPAAPAAPADAAPVAPVSDSAPTQQLPEPPVPPFQPPAPPAAAPATPAYAATPAQPSHAEAPTAQLPTEPPTVAAPQAPAQPYGAPQVPPVPPTPPTANGGGTFGGGAFGGQPPYGGSAPYGVYGAGTPYEKPKGSRRGAFISVLAATAILAGGLGGGLGAWLESRNSGGADASTTVSSSTDPKALSRAPGSIAAIAAKALPSVVTIEASGSSESGTGTGFVFDTQGHILTNNHVVAPSLGGGKLTVKFADGSSYGASVVGRAQGYDVAVIKLDTTPKEQLVPLPLGDSDAVQVGDTTIAIGAPFGLSGTVTSGIVSAKNRPVASGDQTGAQTSYMNALQTDASINPGNSGGPLMNGEGQVIGIDSAIQSSGQSTGGGQSGSIGLGFAIPINQAHWVAEQLIKTGVPVYPIIGILRDDSFTGDGARINSTSVQGTPPVTPGGPADKAGLKPGDVITALDGVIIDSGPTLVSEIWAHHPGDKISVTFTRNGQTHTTTLTLGSRSGDNQ
ncbi:S1C family serine protease [Streptacidiphilus pinicola]|uniref:S1C family serine protease n=1 Tax=Streptacidiphilus pinicola TaxID=2219663 RepID=UPI001FB22C82|nr:trypsin-like peptidase domain-containing protein [Streptacidiphilus pinicola]